MVRTEQETYCDANVKKLFLSNAPLPEKKDGLLGFLVVYLAWPIWNLLDSKHQQQTSLYEQRLGKKSWPVLQEVAAGSFSFSKTGPSFFAVTSPSFHQA